MESKVNQAQPSIDIRDLIGMHVKRIRIESDMTQQALADQCEIYRTYLSRLENGDANPTVKVLASLAKVLKVDVAEFFLKDEAKLRPIFNG